jgi:hypothetical protein
MKELLRVSIIACFLNNRHNCPQIIVSYRPCFLAQKKSKKNIDSYFCKRLQCSLVILIMKDALKRPLELPERRTTLGQRTQTYEKGRRK